MSINRTSHQVAAKVSQATSQAVEGSHELWTTLGVEGPGRIADADAAFREVFQQQKPRDFDVVFRSSEILQEEGVLQVFRGIKAPGNKLLNKQQHAILAGCLEKYQEKSTLSCATLEVHQFRQLEKIAICPNKGRNHLNYDAWRGLDHINFKNVQLCFELLYKEYAKGGFAKIAEEMRETCNCDFREALVGEILAQLLAYSEGLHGQKINIPSLMPDGQIDMVSYTISESRFGDALPCYILERTDGIPLSPWLIIRGTQHHTSRTNEGKEFRTGAFESLLADMIDPNGISEHVVNKALVNSPIIQNSENGLEMRESIGSLLIRCKAEGMKLNVAGHSFGGALGKYLTSQFPGQINKCYSCSAPGISGDSHAIYKKLKQQFETKKKIINILYANDPLTLVGSWQSGTKLLIQSLTPPANRGFIEAHVRLHLTKDFGIRRLHSKEENYKFARYVGEFVRWFLGRIAYSLICVLKPGVIPDWYKHRHIYQVRRNQFIKSYFPEYL